MITHASFRNFKALRSVDIDLQRLTVIVGPNGSGKTSILEGIDVLCKRADKRILEELKDSKQYEAIHSRGTNGSKIDFEVTLEGNDSEIEKVLLQYDRLSPGNWQEVLAISTKKFPHWRLVDPARSLARENILRSLLLRLEPAKLRKPSYPTLSPPTLGIDGEGLASVVGFLRGKYPDLYDGVESGLRKIFPIVKRIRNDRVAMTHTEWQQLQIDRQQIDHPLNKTVIGDSLLFDFVGAQGVPAYSVSEGTLLVLALLTALVNSKGPLLVLIDNIDHGLQPKAQRDLVALLRKLLANDPNLQIVATSHSPFILQELEPEEVRVTSLSRDGSAVVGRIVDHPDFEAWKDAMTPGEFWSHVGEDWLASQELVGAAP